ncbi:MAG TPA: ABC transporter substrate-binding protein [Candidatus Methylomirabilis sp.]
MKRLRGKGWWVSLGLGMTALVLLAGATAQAAEQPVKVSFARLSFPSHVGMATDILKEQGFDRKHGLDVELRNFGAVGAFYAAQATGEADAGIGGPLVYQKMRLEGAPLKVFATLVDMTSMVVIAKDPAIRSLADLKGKTLAAAVASSEYQVLSVVGKSKGVIMGKDVTVVPADPPLARTQLAAGRVDAAMTWEPAATLTMRDNPAYRVIFNAKQGWREITGKDGWLLVLAANEGFLRRSPELIPRLVAAFRDVAQFMRSNPDDADRIVSKSINLPPGAFKEMVVTPRVVFDVRPTTDPAARESIWEVIKVAVAEGFYKQPVPDQSLLYVP